MNKRTIPALTIVLLAAGLLGGCALFGDDRPTPARTFGPPERSFWFLQSDTSPPDPTETIGGRVQVLNGDTLRVDDTFVYLAGIDAPEPDQLCRRASALPYRCGEDMTAILEQRLQRDRVVCDIAPINADNEKAEADRASRKRAIGYCRHYGTNLNEWMVRQGHAVAASADSPYVAAEREAANNKRGLWQGSFERPADWRKRQK